MLVRRMQGANERVQLTVASTRAVGGTLGVVVWLVLGFCGFWVFTNFLPASAAGAAAAVVVVVVAAVVVVAVLVGACWGRASPASPPLSFDEKQPMSCRNLDVFTRQSLVQQSKSLNSNQAKVQSLTKDPAKKVLLSQIEIVSNAFQKPTQNTKKPKAIQQNKKEM